MALTRTLAEMRTDIREKGGYHRSAVFTDTKLTRWINAMAREVREIIIDSNDDYFTEEKTLFTASGSDFVKLPSDFYRLRGIFKVISSDQLVPLLRQDIRRMSHSSNPWVGTFGRSYHYRLQEDKLRLSPVPNSSDELRMFYDPVAKELVADTDKWDTIHGFDELVVAKVLMICDEREDKPTAAREAKIAKLEKRVARAVSRDSNEPFLLPDNSTGTR